MRNTDINPIEFDAALLALHGGIGKRYTSYPTADRFIEAFDEHRYLSIIANRQVSGGNRPLSLYVHLPFCKKICFYCACNKVGTTDQSQADRYLDYLGREVALQRANFKTPPKLNELHIGGGTPTFLNNGQLTRLLDLLHDAFAISATTECTIEIDPRDLADGALALLAEYGFKQMSMGVQDVDPAVQNAINREQPTNLVEHAITEGRRRGFRSINLDLLYGLPQQTLATLRTTLDTVVHWRPERIALYRYWHAPDRFKPQRHIAETSLPSQADCLAMLKLAIDTLLAAGYVYIGMDHFALPEDDLAVALRQGRLHRNFQGYSTHADNDLLAFGVSAISKVGASYSQNHRELNDYYDTLDQGHLPLSRGVALSADDLLRRAVIQALLCQSELAIEPFETAWLIDFRQYFAPEMAQLARLAIDGLVELEVDAIRITPKGRLLANTVSMCFDRYSREAQNATRLAQPL